MTWRRGDQVLLRYVRPERVSLAVPVTVVEDGPELIALHVACGTPVKRPVALDGRTLREIPAAERYRMTEWRLADSEWRHHDVLHLVRPGAAHSIWVGLAEATGEFVGWYVNLQDPLRRTRLGFDTRDHILDIVVEPDLTWSWKDEDDFAEAERLGRLSREEARAIRAEGERVIEAIERREWPFASEWRDWRPDPAWPIPRLPDGWDVLEPERR